MNPVAGINPRLPVRVFFAAVLFLVLFLPGNASARPYSPQSFKGWPGHDDISDLAGCFANPPKGYGNVPFYWWTGDSLDVARLREQLDILADASTDGFCVSYNHTHKDVEVELNAPGHGPCGRVSGGKPRVMSEDWWKVWNEFSAMCAEKGIGVGMDDYVIAWPRNGEFIDSILAKPSFREYQGQLKLVRAGRGDAVSGNMVTVARSDADSVTYVCTEAAPWLHPDFGREIVSNYFQPFVDHMDPAALRGMNYFFQDELQYGLNLTSWSEDMPKQFRRMKGYDIVPHLGDLFITDPAGVDEEKAKVRLDYAEVLTRLAEKRYFKPIYDWNASKGLIYGCDPEGRGLRPTKYLDYFRAISWFTAPGNDAPARGSSFRQTKVSSSIAHLYGRPRTWLEAFHSMGWDANGAVLKRQLDHHIIAGGNLLCMHGLYYSTHGGWWEWAPPCFHFRMPYWPHMKLWLRYAERMCFLLSQGVHVCDIALMYPTETMQAIPGTKPSLTFAVSDSLSTHGLDYDFIDYQSLQKARKSRSSLIVSGESYKVLVLADAAAMHGETLSAIRKFIRKGGKVVAVGNVMPALRKAGAIVIDDASSLVSVVNGLINPDFSTASGRGRVLHRRIGEKDVYMVMDVPGGDVMHFRAWGKAEIWNAMDGSVEPLPVLGQDGSGTSVRYDGPSDGSMLVVFSPGEAVSSGGADVPTEVSSRHVDGDWDVEVIPVLDNRRGDFRLPAFDGKIGVEAREMHYSSPDGGLEGKDIYGYGPYMMSCVADPSLNIDTLVGHLPDTLSWKPYVWSWQYGVPDSPGSQGWHGLKCRVDPCFLILDRGGHQFFRTDVIVPQDGEYDMLSEGVRPHCILLDGGRVEPGRLELTKGRHTLLVAYADTKATPYSLRKMRGEGLDKRDRGMVVFYPAASSGPVERGMYDSIVASKWYGTDVLAYDIPDAPGEWMYSFETAPGAGRMSLVCNGRVNAVYIDGNVCGSICCRDGETVVELPPDTCAVRTVRVVGVPDTGFPGAAFFAEPVKIECGKGRMPEGDWTGFGALAYYSGAVRYTRNIELDAFEGRIELDLGDVDATCEVRVNGCDPLVLIDRPYSLDITRYVHPGDNTLDVLVNSSLSNHYSTIPSPYRGTPRAGLLGPVRVVFLSSHP